MILAAVFPEDGIIDVTGQAVITRAARSEARTEPGGPAGPESRTSGPLPFRFVCWGCGRAALDADLSFAALFEDVPVQGLRVSRCRMCGAGMLCFEAGFFTDTDIEELREHFERSLPGGAVSP